MNFNDNDFIYKNNNSILEIEKKGIIEKNGYPNIALIKYWGKKKNLEQIPYNSSISYMLKNIYTKTKLTYEVNKKNNNPSIKFFFCGVKNHFFYLRIKNFFEKIFIYCPYLKNFNFIIETYNNFPHSSGIGSSSSSMSSIALCIMEIEKKISFLTKYFFLRKASFLARLGSGSACRSIYPGLSIWGIHKLIKGSSNLYSIPYPYTVHKIFKKIENTILIIDEKPKNISSSKGHELMNKHPYAKNRFKNANYNMERIISALRLGDIKEFGKIIEKESLDLHAMIMTSNPYYLLIKPNTINVIQSIWDFRIQTNNDLYFTLDAGANLHLLYPFINKKIVFKWIKDNLSFYCKKIIKSFCIWN
ncbi:diphosphomevalonate/mevalonate 3,5-bisphosphate decarboxylase family protein [Blattabacterium cuenoti]|uniref:diphosphomevalonate/mevalonate 3,5-bisphosphate decarboxylase family protein n=1 Tax=Blattabacterium cuenoti TaxID=1653831 RepID=UPI001EEB785D|nr:diphosphomevalonate decarboxylase [Blattabacterium cuenoti]